MTSTAFTKAAAPASPPPLPPPAADPAADEPVPSNQVLGLYGFVLIRILISRNIKIFSLFLFFVIFQIFRIQHSAAE